MNVRQSAHVIEEESGVDEKFSFPHILLHILIHILLHTLLHILLLFCAISSTFSSQPLSSVTPHQHHQEVTRQDGDNDAQKGGAQRAQRIS